MRHIERLELKYHVTAAKAEALRRAITPWCTPDSHTTGPLGYPIFSLYLDSPLLEFHKARARGDADRVKLRIRTYGPGTDAWLEVKRKVRKVVHKLRAPVPRGRAVAVAQGLEAFESGRAESIPTFQSLVARCGAEPKLTVAYMREAFASTVDSYARVTFDRNIRARRSLPSDWTLHHESTGPDWCALDGFGHLDDGVSSSVLLELKCETFMPRWMNDLITRFELVSTGFSKYSKGIESCGLGGSPLPPGWRF